MALHARAIGDRPAPPAARHVRTLVDLQSCCGDENLRIEGEATPSFDSPLPFDLFEPRLELSFR